VHNHIYLVEIILIMLDSHYNLGFQVGEGDLLSIMSYDCHNH